MQIKLIENVKNVIREIKYGSLGAGMKISRDRVVTIAVTKLD